MPVKQRKWVFFLTFRAVENYSMLQDWTSFPGAARNFPGTWLAWFYHYLLFLFFAYEILFNTCYISQQKLFETHSTLHDFSTMGIYSAARSKIQQLSHSMTKPKTYVRPSKTQISMGIRLVGLRVFSLVTPIRRGGCHYFGFVGLRLNHYFICETCNLTKVLINMLSEKYPYLNTCRLLASNQINWFFFSMEKMQNRE